MNKVIVGIDISKKTFDASFKNAQNKWKHSSFENITQGFNKFREWLSQNNIKDVHIIIEATGRYGEQLSYFCHNHGLNISVVNPARIKYYGLSKLSRTKTDKADSKLIAEFGMHHDLDLDLWSPKSPCLAKLQALERCINNLKDDRTGLLNRIEGSSDKDVIKVYKSLLSTLEKKIVKLEEQMLKLVQQDEQMKKDYSNLLSYPGIGSRTALSILAEIPDINMFDHVKQLTAYAGLNPSVKQSGTSVCGRGSISRKGSKQLRKSLYMPSLSGRRYNPKLKTFADRLATRGKKPKQIIVACMRKMLEAVYWILKKQEPYIIKDKA